MGDITTTFTNTRPICSKANKTKDEENQDGAELNILRININNVNTTSKHVWSIPVNASTVDMVLDDSKATAVSNMTQPSDVTSLDRINDIDLVESRLSDLRFMEETSL